MFLRGLSIYTSWTLIDSLKFVTYYSRFFYFVFKSIISPSKRAYFSKRSMSLLSLASWLPYSFTILSLSFNSSLSSSISWEIKIWISLLFIFSLSCSSVRLKEGCSMLINFELLWVETDNFLMVSLSCSFYFVSSLSFFAIKFISIWIKSKVLWTWLSLLPWLCAHFPKISMTYFSGQVHFWHSPKTLSKTERSAHS